MLIVSENTYANFINAIQSLLYIFEYLRSTLCSVFSRSLPEAC